MSSCRATNANALMREGYPVPACYLDTLIAEERAR